MQYSAKHKLLRKFHRLAKQIIIQTVAVVISKNNIDLKKPRVDYKTEWISTLRKQTGSNVSLFLETHLFYMSMTNLSDTFRFLPDLISHCQTYSGSLAA